MNIIPYSNKIDDYLKEDEVIDFTNDYIVQLANKLKQSKRMVGYTNGVLNLKAKLQMYIN